MPNSFEVKFAQLANTTLAERVPSLADNRIGFQLIDKNDDETQALGIAAYIINDLYCYIPVFFLDGELKGMDLLYIYQRDSFVPSNDSWISMLKQEGMSALGKPLGQGYERDTKEKFYGPEDVSTSEYDSIFSYKNASDSFDPNSGIVHKDVAAKMLSKIPRNLKEAVDKFSLESNLPLMGKQANEVFVNTVLKDPGFANSYLTFNDVDKMERILKQAAEDMVVKAGEPDKDDVIFITNNAEDDLTILDKKEKRLLLTQGLYVKDNRTNFSKVYQEQIDTNVCQNPTEPGIYDVMMADKSFKTFILLFPHTIADCPPHSRRSMQNVMRHVALIDIDNPSEYYLVKAEKLYVKPSTQITEKQTSALQGGKEATKANIGREVNRIKNAQNEWSRGILLVQNSGCAIETSLNAHDNKDADTIVVPAHDGGAYVDTNSYEANLPRKAPLHFVGPKNRLQLYEDIVFVPEGTRVFYRNRKDVPEFGCPKIVQRVIAKEAGEGSRPLLSIKSSPGSTQNTIYFGGESTGLIDKLAALKYLTLNHGIYAGQAQQLLKEASEAPGNFKRFRIKHLPAYEKLAYNLDDYGDSVMQPFNGGPSPQLEQAYQYRERRVGGAPLSGPVDASGASMLPRDVVDRANQAAQAGIEEVFDVEVMKGLIGAADLSELRKNNLADMVKGMDATGRLLFLFYWHKENFEEKYGANELTQLENTLKNVFQSQGDLILFLREKSVYNDNFSENLFGALSEDLGSSAEA